MENKQMEFANLLSINNSNSNNNNNNNSQTVAANHPRLYKRRWLILALFVLFAFGASTHWVEFSIINGSVAKFYEISPYAVDWTTQCYMVLYSILFIPIVWSLDKLGIRQSLIGTSAGICVGSWIKWFSVSADRFYLLLIGQCIVASNSVIMFGTAARLTAVWFGADEISLAGSIALFGDELGTAVSFIFPTFVVKEVSNQQLIGFQLQQLSTIIAIGSTVILILIIFFMRSEPPLPPSTAQILQKEMKNKKMNFWKSVRKVLSKPSFLFLLVSYGFNIGGYNAFSTILSQLLDPYFPGNNEYAGNCGFLTVLTGMIGTVAVGYFLDRTRLFKTTSVFLTFSTMISMIAFTFCLRLQDINMIYFICGAQGFFQLCYYSGGLQMGIEVTYPVTEEITAGLMLLSVHVHGVIITNVYGYMVRNVGIFQANTFMCALYMLSCLLTLVIPANMNRQQAETTLITATSVLPSANNPTPATTARKQLKSSSYLPIKTHTANTFVFDVGQ